MPSIEIFNSIDGFFFILCLIPFVIICWGMYVLHDYIEYCQHYQIEHDLTYGLGKLLILSGSIDLIILIVAPIVRQPEPVYLGFEEVEMEVFVNN